MKILGISNPSFVGVTVATKATCTEYIPVPAQQNMQPIYSLVSSIMKSNPDLLLIGGWSPGYSQLVQELKRAHRKFNIVCVYHSTIYHGSYFGDNVYIPQIIEAKNSGYIDYIGFVQPQTAEYFTKVKEIKSYWVPHAFPIEKKKPESEFNFRIGVLGGNQWYKNSEGAISVAKDFVRTHKISETIPGSIFSEKLKNKKKPELITQLKYDKTPQDFLKLLSSCDLIIHPSFLECYPNILQEAWARGIPTITSPAASGLIASNPLLKEDEQELLGALTTVSDPTDAMLLFKMMTDIMERWDDYSESTYSIYSSLSQRTRSYLTDLFNGFIAGRHD